MARILPSDWKTVHVTGAAAREIETLVLLETALPDDLTVLHGVHWSRIQRGFAVVGEIDFVVLSPGGRILLIEQKSGFLDETPEGLVKIYGENRKHVGTQIDRTIDGLRTRLAPLVRGEPIVIDYLLYCPDYIVKNRAAAGIPDERIIDAPRRDSLARRIKEALGEESLRPDLARRLLDFFSSELDLVPDTAALVGQADALVTRLAGGLATWARRLEFSPFRLRVTATAGSGKTLLALAILADAARAGRQALYVCYNRPLADHIALVAPPGSSALTFHQLCEREVRKAGHVPDFRQDGAFDDLAIRFANLPPNSDLADELIIDEGQDFEADWIQSLLGRAKSDARIWFLEDPMQQLYQRARVDLQDFVNLRDDTNYRTPRRILHYVNQLVKPEREIEAASPIEGADVEFLDYSDTTDLLDKTKRAITLALLAKFRKHDIAVVTFAGRGNSKILPFDALGPHRLKSFTGRYDLLGTPEYCDGEVLIETVYRFKGQSAPCVILTEVDFEEFDERARRKLFVGMTRASMKLFVVISNHAAGVLLGAVEPVAQIHR